MKFITITEGGMRYQTRGAKKASTKDLGNRPIDTIGTNGEKYPLSLQSSFKSGHEVGGSVGVQSGKRS